jgi:hypothetical protein
VGIVLINQSSAISDDEVRQTAEACDTQLREHVAPAWNFAEPLSVAFATEVAADSFPFLFVDDIPEAPGALAYHYVEDNGMPAGKIGVNTTLQANESVSAAASHEAVELQCDIFCAAWSFSSEHRCLVATEACDPVQSYSYQIGDVDVSDFVTPYYFTDNALGHELDYLGMISKPFEIAPGGYQIRLKAGRVYNRYGDQFSDALRAAKDASHTRTYWRQITVAIALQPDE